MKKKRAILSTGGISVSNYTRGPIRAAASGAEAHVVAKKDLEKLEKHYGLTGNIIIESDPLWNGGTDPIFD
jgi:hypothetical protein